MASAPAAIPGPVERFHQWSLLAMLASGYCALLGAGILDWPAATLTFAALLLRGFLAAEVVRFEFPPRAVAALTLAYVGFFPLDFLYVSGTVLPAIVHMILFLTVLKVVTATTPRDFAYLKIIAGMELLAAATLSFRPSFFLFLALFLIASIAAFASGEIRSSASEYTRIVRGGTLGFPRRLAAFTTASFVGILLLSAGVFFVLPRTARSAFQRFVPARYRLPGFANEITLGEIGEIKQNSRAVMHIRSYSAGNFSNVRWRGSSLSQFDGKRWSNPDSSDVWLRVERGVMPLRRANLSHPGRTFAYQVELNDVASDTLFFAGTPQSISINVAMLRFSNWGSIRTPPGAFVAGMGYAVNSYVEDGFAPVVGAPPPDGIPGLPRENFLQLPSIDSRIPLLAKQMAADGVTDYEKARALEHALRTRYGYTLQLLTEPVADPLAHFLFVRRKGHCEYFASSMAVMLRTLGIPSRIATGFLGGVFNPITGWQVVRASDAHSWVEAWIDGRWMTFDPTPPDTLSGNSLLSRAMLFFDAADQFWQDWVVGYNLERQVILANRMGDSSRNMQFPKFDAFSGFNLDTLFFKVLGIVGALGFLCAGAWKLFGRESLKWWRARAGFRRAQRGQGQASDATLLYERMLAYLSKRNIRKPPHITPEEFARSLTEPSVSPLVLELTGLYNEFRFGAKPAAAPRMLQLLDQLEQLP
jgi:transglutaminase-like putative cysteine protease